MFKIIISLVTILASFLVEAHSPFPRGCEVTGFNYLDYFLILNERGGQTFYLIQNHSSKPITIEHQEIKDVFMSPKLHSQLDSLNWSAFASDEQNFYFKCKIDEGIILPI